MGLIYTYARLCVTTVSLFFFVFITLTITFAAQDPLPPRGGQSSQGRNLQVRLSEDTSLHQLIQKNGYALADKDVAAFLAEFSKLNEGLRSISSIKKGTVVRLPLSQLVRDTAAPVRPEQRKRVSGQKGRNSQESKPAAAPRRREEPVLLPEPGLARRSQAVQVIRRLVEELYGLVALEQTGLRYFSVGQRSEISFDSTAFPLMVLKNGIVLVLDPTDSLPVEIRQLIRLVWPEYVFVSYRDGQDLRTVIDELLVALGYTVRRDTTLIAGGHSQIEYRADFVIFKKEDDLLEGDLVAVSLIGPHEREVPASLVHWFRARDIRLIQLGQASASPGSLKGAEVRGAISGKDTRSILESIISGLGYSPARDTVLHLSDRREFKFNLRADISFTEGKRTKVIEFAELSAQEIAFARKNGVDVICVDEHAELRSVLRQMVDLLGIPHADTPEFYSDQITPRNVRYRLALQGIYVKTPKGSFFITDSGLGSALLRDVAAPDLTVITY